MSNFDDFKKAAKDTFETIADFSSEAYKIAEDKAKTLARRAKLTADITKQRTVIRRRHIEIGITYYKLFKDSPDESLRECCETITQSLRRIASMEKELEELRRRVYTGSKDQRRDTGGFTEAAKETYAPCGGDGDDEENTASPGCDECDCTASKGSKADNAAPECCEDDGSATKGEEEAAAAPCSDIDSSDAPISDETPKSGKMAEDTAKAAETKPKEE